MQLGAFKDTHSPRGDLLVVHSPDDDPNNPHKVPANSIVLGFNSPVFGPDLILPAAINENLRDLVVAGHGSEGGASADDNGEYAALLLTKFPGHSVPQVLCFWKTAYCSLSTRRLSAVVLTCESG